MNLSAILALLLGLICGLTGPGQASEPSEPSDRIIASKQRLESALALVPPNPVPQEVLRESSERIRELIARRFNLVQAPSKVDRVAVDRRYERMDRSQFVGDLIVQTLNDLIWTGGIFWLT